MGRVNKPIDYETPVKTKCIPAAPGTKAIVRSETGAEIVGPTVIAWTVGIAQHEYGDIWPNGTWAEAITFNPDANILGVVHPDGSVDYGDGQTFASVAEWKAEYEAEWKRERDRISNVKCGNLTTGSFPS